MRNLFTDYCEAHPDLMPFYPAPPHALFQPTDLAAEWDDTLVSDINAYQRTLGGTGVLTGDEIAVVTGQQPGLFTGPLYTIYKAATAIRAARDVEQATGRRCVPIFWLAGDDHDFDEARSATLLTKRHEPMTLTYAPEVDIAGLPMYRVPLETSLRTFIDRAAAETPGSEYRAEIAKFLHASLDVSSSLADWCARLLARLFQDTPLVVFSPHLPRARQLAAEIVAEEIEHPLLSSKLVNEAGAALTDLGYPQQVQKNDSECGFFVEQAGRRRKVIYRNGAFHLPEEKLRYSHDEMAALLREEPERFSANVALRCIVQQRLFPTVAYVAGPGEIAYWAQLAPLFGHFGLREPIVYPRARCLLSTTKINALLQELGLALNQLHDAEEILARETVQRTADGPALSLLRTQGPGLERQAEQLARALADADPGAAGIADTFVAKVRKNLQRMEQTLAKNDEAHARAVRDQVHRLCMTIAPWRKPQERVYTVFSFLFEHGWPLVGRLTEAFDIVSFTVNEVEL